ncbi:hypothetical protein [Lentzea aerocolonigenes]|nr:hypothetical protein [Lentzea aerocolonigenes]
MEEIEYIKNACAELGEHSRAVFALAAASRVMSVYQVYGEVRPGLRGADSSHDAIVAVVRFIRELPNATREKALRKVEAALIDLAHDLPLVQDREEFDLAEAVTVEAITSMSLALTGWKDYSAEACFQAVMGALEVDAVWSEGVALEAVSWDRVTAQQRQQFRDIEELRSAVGIGAADVYRSIMNRAERECMPYLAGMEKLMET